MHDVDNVRRSGERIHPAPPRSDGTAKERKEAEATGNATDHPKDGPDSAALRRGETACRFQPHRQEPKDIVCDHAGTDPPWPTTRQGAVASQRPALKIVTSKPCADSEPGQVETEVAILKIEWWHEEGTPRPLKCLESWQVNHSADAKHRRCGGQRLPLGPSQRHRADAPGPGDEEASREKVEEQQQPNEPERPREPFVGDVLTPMGKVSGIMPRKLPGSVAGQWHEQQNAGRERYAKPKEPTARECECPGVPQRRPHKEPRGEEHQGHEEYVVEVLGIIEELPAGRIDHRCGGFE